VRGIISSPAAFGTAGARRRDDGARGGDCWWRAYGLRTIEVLDQRGIADRFLAEGKKAQVAGFANVILDISGFPTRHPYGLGLWQKHIERILAGWVRELKVPINYGVEVTGFAQDDAGVDVALSDRRKMRAQYLVGCDGGRSLVRKTAGIDFPGWNPTMSNLIGEVELTEMPPLGVQHSTRGTFGFSRLEYEVVDGKVVFKDEGRFASWYPSRNSVLPRNPRWPISAPR
jgi:2-polyprenyl-6-methoxyphenol hydroxylase-like FAD-dependent oxidoreductase